MRSEFEELFDNPAERAAYEAFCEGQERGSEAFELGEPVLVCRWRMHARRVPLLNRHMRALSQRRVNGAPLGTGLLSWAKQHVEWSVAEGAYGAPDGVLMLVVDAAGNAAMSVGEYAPLADTRVFALAARAADAAREAEATGVAPELLCAVAGGRLLMGAPEGQHLCGVATLVEQLAQTRGIEVARAPELRDVPELREQGAASADCAYLAAGAACTTRPALADAVPFLVSDEHGVVPAAEGAASQDDAALVEFLATGYAKLFA